MKDIYDEYLTEEEVAKFLNISVGTLRNRISVGKDHPPVIKKLNKFRKEAFKDWLKSKEARERKLISRAS